MLTCAQQIPAGIGACAVLYDLVSHFNSHQPAVLLQVDMFCCDVDCLDRGSLAFVVGCQEPDNMQHQPQLLRFARIAQASKQVIALVGSADKVSACSLQVMPLL